MDILVDKYIYMKQFYDNRDEYGTIEYNTINSILNNNLYNEFNKNLAKPIIKKKIPKKTQKNIQIYDVMDTLDVITDKSIKDNSINETKKITILPPKEAVITNQNIKRIIINPENMEPSKNNKN